MSTLRLPLLMATLAVFATSAVPAGGAGSGGIVFSKRGDLFVGIWTAASGR